MDALDEAFQAQGDSILKKDEEAKMFAIADSGTFEDKEKWEDSYKEYSKARRQVKAKFKHAMVLAQQLYGVGPAVTGGEPRNGLFAGNSASWNPQVWDDEPATVYKANRAGKTDVYVTRFDDGDFGVTENNGDVFLSMTLFREVAIDGNPLRLALTLAHEGAHFTKLVKSGLAGHFEGEADASDVEYAAAVAIAGAQNDLSKDVKGKAETYRSKAKHGRDVPEAMTEEQSNRNAKVWNTEFQAQRDRLQARLAAERRAREQDAIRDALEQGRRNAEASRRFDDAHARLDELSSRFCEDDFLFITPPNVTAWADALDQLEFGHLALVDYSKTQGTMACAVYVKNQALLAMNLGFRPGWEAWLVEAVREGRHRERDPWPSSAPRAADPPSAVPQPTPPPAPGPVPPPPPHAPERPERPTRPSRPDSEPCYGTTCGPLGH